MRVCFVAPNAYPAIDPEVSGPIGGNETRAWAFARGLAQREDADVSFVVRRSGGLPSDCVEGVQLIPIADRFYRLAESVGTHLERTRRPPWLRLKSWDHRLLWRLPLLAVARACGAGRRDPRAVDPALAAIDADLFVTFGVQSHSATVIASAHSTNRPAVLMIGSEGDLDERYRPGSDFVSPYGDRADVCYEVLQQADAIVAQTADQQALLRERFDRDAQVIENPIDVRQWDEGRGFPLTRDETAGLERYVLWVGRAEAVHKRPQVCLDLARLCPEVEFLMILNPKDSRLERDIRRGAPANVSIVPAVPFSRMPAVFARAVALVNTSSLEGFPNVFLQAAVSGAPIASLEVGGPFLDWLGCGHFANGDLGALADFLKAVWEGRGPQRESLQAARDRVVARYGLAEQLDSLLQLLRDVAADDRAASLR